MDFEPQPLRVIIRVRVMDIPSERNARVRCLGNSFCQQVLGREMNLDFKARCYDAEHCLPNFDSKYDIKAWFLYDFNVTGTLDKAEVMKIRHKVYLATRQEESWIFTLRDIWIEKAKKGCATYTWGGNYTTK
ncbi:hypothetical protein LAWI1_G008530 [Lachnellula willkommii]|uniref:Uncharacterized protein n=1 Tax=Lachnellula willkommii TaxID=215461 RepID=A0A559M6P0_9HELO|nr:hypothetical protein LAWI1_G008530 [Lachnellula willkommii]